MPSASKKPSVVGVVDKDSADKNEEMGVEQEEDDGEASAEEEDEHNEEKEESEKEESDAVGEAPAKKRAKKAVPQGARDQAKALKEGLPPMRTYCDHLAQVSNVKVFK